MAWRPSLFLGVDAPDFNLDLERGLRAAGIPTAHFIGPSVWAWRRERLARIREAVDHMLLVFPFEPAIYEAAGIPATYVGHPLADAIPGAHTRETARQALGLPASATVYMQAVELRTGDVCGLDMSAANLYRWHPAYAAGATRRRGVGCSAARGAVQRRPGPLGPLSQPCCTPCRSAAGG